MAQVRPKILLRYGRINLPIRVPISDQLVDPLAFTYLSADTPSGQSSINVKNITGFFANQILLIGEPGQQGSEIIQTSHSTNPSVLTIQLASSTVYPHSAGTKIYR